MPTPRRLRSTARPEADRLQRQNALNQVIAGETHVVVRELGTGRESAPETGIARVTAVALGAESIVITGYPPEGGPAANLRRRGRTRADRADNR